MHKLRTKAPEGARQEPVQKYGYDVKFAYHVVRLLGEVEQLLVEGTMDLERNREQLKSIRRGEWSLEKLEDWVGSKESDLEAAYARSDLPSVPPTDTIKALLMECLESYFGSLPSGTVQESEAVKALRDIDRTLESVRASWTGKP